MATKLDDTKRPLYVDSVALKALINRIGVLRESLREEMKHLNVEVDSSKFITKELFDAHIEDYNQFKLSTTTKLTEITEILSRMVSPGDVEEAYTEATNPPAPKYELKKYRIYHFPKNHSYSPDLTENELNSMVEEMGPESYVDETNTIFKDGEFLAFEDSNGNYYTPSVTCSWYECGSKDIFANEFYIYKRESATPINIDDYVILDGTQMA